MKLHSYNRQRSRYTLSGVSFLAVLAVQSCGLNQDISGFESTGFDPLSAPGTRRVVEKGDPTEKVMVGSYVQVEVPNTFFYKELPNASSKASGVLAQGVALVIVEKKRDLYKVRQVENGIEGYVVKSTVSKRPIVLEPEGEEPLEAGLLPEGDGLLADGGIGDAAGAGLVKKPETNPLVPDDGADPGALVKDDNVDPGAIVADDGVEAGSIVKDDTGTDKPETKKDKPEGGQ